MKAFNRFFERWKSLSTHFLFNYWEQGEVIGCQMETAKWMTHQIDLLCQNTRWSHCHDDVNLPKKQMVFWFSRATVASWPVLWRKTNASWTNNFCWLCTTLQTADWSFFLSHRHKSTTCYVFRSCRRLRMHHSCSLKLFNGTNSCGI